MLLVAALSCKKVELENSFMLVDEPYSLEIPVGFPMPSIPEDNELTKLRVELGKKLFFDPVLSKNRTISCASCHLPSQAFADTNSVSIGVFGRQGLRNSPSLANIAYKPEFFMDGGVPTLEMQSVAPLQDHVEMDNNILEVTEKLKENKDYIQLSKWAYFREIGPFVITRALAAYQRTLISGNSRYDQFVRGDLPGLTSSEERGKDLFFSERTNCGNCHSGFNFTNYSYQNIGLYTNYRDSGRMRITLNEEDRGSFVVPSLRNIELTAPYMHNGSIKTLKEVIDFFDSGGHINPNKSNLVRKLHLNESEKIDLVNFLKSLTDDDFIRKN